MKPRTAPHAPPDTTRHASPFLKWAGGKRRLLPAILPRLPARIRTYYEPFVGGGAVFFALAREGRFARAMVGDQNGMLVEIYLAVRDRIGEVIAQLRVHAARAGDRGHYYETRALDPAALDPVHRAANLLYMNKTCYNGLFRVNSAGRFNVPFGRHTNPRVLDEDLLRAASRALAGVEIVEADFEEIAGRAGEGDAIYFDPPYLPLSRTSSFTAYGAAPFGAAEHERLARAYRACLDRGAAAVLSNSWCPRTLALYDGLACEKILASRSINSAPGGRGRIPELLVTGRG